MVGIAQKMGTITGCMMFGVFVLFNIYHRHKTLQLVQRDPWVDESRYFTCIYYYSMSFVPDVYIYLHSLTYKNVGKNQGKQTCRMKGWVTTVTTPLLPATTLWQCKGHRKLPARVQPKYERRDWQRMHAWKWRPSYCGLGHGHEVGRWGVPKCI